MVTFLIWHWLASTNPWSLLIRQKFIYGWISTSLTVLLTDIYSTLLTRTEEINHAVNTWAKSNSHRADSMMSNCKSGHSTLWCEFPRPLRDCGISFLNQDMSRRGLSVDGQGWPLIGRTYSLAIISLLHQGVNQTLQNAATPGVQRTSNTIIRMYLNQHAINARWPVIKQALTPHHKVARLQWSVALEASAVEWWPVFWWDTHLLETHWDMPLTLEVYRRTTPWQLELERCWKDYLHYGEW